MILLMMLPRLVCICGGKASSRVEGMSMRHVRMRQSDLLKGGVAVPRSLMPRSLSCYCCCSQDCARTASNKQQARKNKQQQI